MIDLNSIRRQAEMLTDEALLSVERDDLVEAARKIYDDEVASRGLEWPASASVSSGDDDEAEPATVEPGKELVSIAKYESIEEARFARALLENEGIPAWFVGELSPLKITGDPRAGLELLTQAEHLEQALAVLSSEISEEELARQAEEAAGVKEHPET